MIITDMVGSLSGRHVYLDRSTPMDQDDQAEAEGIQNFDTCLNKNLQCNSNSKGKKVLVENCLLAIDFNLF